jgi:uncharacterized membrane protein YcjF (UPF0283 family)
VLDDKEAAKYDFKLEDEVKLKLEKEEKLQAKTNKIREEIEQAVGFEIPVGFRRFYSMALWLIAAVMGMFLVTEVVRFVSGLKALPLWAQWLSSVCLIIFASIIVFVLFSILISIIKLQKTPQISTKAMKKLSERRCMQEDIQKRSAKSKRELKKYLGSYFLDGKKRNQLRKMGMTEEDLEKLDIGQRYLLESRLSTEDWIEDFGKKFQAVLDDFANKRVEKHANYVGVGTATVSIAMIDRWIVLYGCMAMIKDLLVIYNLRPAFGQSLLIFSKSIIYIYMSGLVEDAAEVATQSAVDFSQKLTEDGVNVLSGPITKVVGAKVTEFLVNKILLKRLGKRAISLLQPVR